jgi:hypothetical protein
LICLLVGSLVSLAFTMSDTMPSDHSDLDSSMQIHSSWRIRRQVLMKIPFYYMHT